MKLIKLFIIGFSSILLTGVASAEDKEKGKDKPKHARKTFEELDTNKDGKISEAEFLAPAKSQKKAKARFAKKDEDKDGFLTKKELKKGPGKKGPKKPKKKKKGPKKEEPAAE